MSAGKVGASEATRIVHEALPRNAASSGRNLSCSTSWRRASTFGPESPGRSTFAANAAVSTCRTANSLRNSPPDCARCRLFFKRRKVNEAKLELATQDSANPAHIEMAHQVATAPDRYRCTRAFRVRCTFRRRLLSLASTIGVAYATSAGATWEFNAFGNIITHACGVSTVRARTAKHT